MMTFDEYIDQGQRLLDMQRAHEDGQRIPWLCSTCDGTGWVDVGVANMLCPTCDGRGGFLPDPDDPS